jgi:archaeosine synthase
MHYDVPVTGYWDAEECAYISDILAKYLTKNKYDRVIAHLEGGALKVAEMAAEASGITLEYTCREHPTGEAALTQLSHALDCERKVKDERLHGMLSYQFGCDVDTRGMLFRATSRRSSIQGTTSSSSPLTQATASSARHSRAGTSSPKATGCRSATLSPRGTCLSRVW